MNERIHVAVGVIYNAQKDKVLISKRSDKQHLSGLWEFPGGKVEQGEELEAALKRELYEELGITVKHAKHLMDIKHDYHDKHVFLAVYSVCSWSGHAQGRENQELLWTAIENLHNYPFPDANRQIINSISLPDIYLLSQESCQDKPFFLSVLEDCFLAGLRLFQLRLNENQDQYYHDLLNLVCELSRDNHAKVILNARAEDAEMYNIHGIHLNSKRLFEYSSRPIGNQLILGASCHNETEIMQAEKLNADYIFISPVKQTKTHPLAKPTGWDRFSCLAKETSIPVFALGGLCPGDKGLAKSQGAHGIAMISGIWGNKFPAEIIKRCCR